MTMKIFAADGSEGKSFGANQSPPERGGRGDHCDSTFTLMKIQPQNNTNGSPETFPPGYPETFESLN